MLVRIEKFKHYLPPAKRRTLHFMQSCQTGTIIKVMHKKEKMDTRFHKIKKTYEAKQTGQTNFSPVRTASFL